MLNVGAIGLAYAWSSAGFGLHQPHSPHTLSLLLISPSKAYPKRKVSTKEKKIEKPKQAMLKS